MLGKGFPRKLLQLLRGIWLWSSYSGQKFCRRNCKLGLHYRRSCCIAHNQNHCVDLSSSSYTRGKQDRTWVVQQDPVVWKSKSKRHWQWSKELCHLWEALDRLPQSLSFHQLCKLLSSVRLLMIETKLSSLLWRSQCFCFETISAIAKIWRACWCPQWCLLDCCLHSETCHCIQKAYSSEMLPPYQLKICGSRSYHPRASDLWIDCSHRRLREFFCPSEFHLWVEVEM